jgi:uncharacterized protein (DUF433 family)
MDIKFPLIEIRSSAVGDQAYVCGSRLAVWEVVLLAGNYHGNLDAVAAHLQWPLARVEAAIRYADAFPEEIDLAIREYEAVDFDSLKRMLPDLLEVRSSVVARR